MGNFGIYSVGHSDLPVNRFIELIADAGVTAIADVRTSPYSKRYPWFSQRELKGSLRDVGVSYAYVGLELGGRPEDPHLFDSQGIADYESMAKSQLYKAGVQRIFVGMEKYRIAMVCSERDPLNCHRCLMVGRTLLGLGIQTSHIHHDGRIETQADAEQRLLVEERLDADDFLRPVEGRLREAYDRRRKRVAYGSESLKGSAEGVR